MCFHIYSRGDYLNTKCGELSKDALEVCWHFTDDEVTSEANSIVWSTTNLKLLDKIEHHSSLCVCHASLWVRIVTENAI